MSKKLLAALIALSMVGAYACGGDDDDNGGEKCTAGAKKCDGNAPQVCSNKGEWITGAACTTSCVNGECTPAGCDTASKAQECAAQGKDIDVANCACKDKAPVVDPTCDTTAKTAECLAQGKDFDAANCACKDKTTQPDPSQPVDPSAGCDEATYAGECSTDGLIGYYCKDGQKVPKNCTDGKTCKVKGKNSVSCEDPNATTECTGEKVATGGTVGQCCDRNEYTQTCTNGGKNALVCWDDKVTEWTCSTCQDAGYDASKPLQVKCERSTEPASCDGKLKTGGNVGDACDRNCYTQTCTNSGKNALVCWDDKVTEWTCSTCQDAGYDASKPLQVKCDRASEPSTLTECSKTVDENCEKCQNVCDGNSGYYCNTKTSKIEKKDCAVSCAIVDNSVKCDGTCNGNTVTTGGKVGDCCDQNTYKPTGCDTGLRCNSQGVVVQWTCPSYSEPEKTKCDYDATSTEYPGGKFSCVAP